MEFETLIFVIAALLVGLGKGGLATVSSLGVPTLAIWVDPLYAAGVLLPIYIISDMVAVWLYRRDYSRPNVRCLAIWGVAGVIIAGVIAPVLSTAWLTLATGLVGLFYCAQATLSWMQGGREAKPFDPVRGAFWGVVIGITSFISHNGAPPFQAFVLPQKLPKLIYVGTITMTFTVVNVAKIPAYASIGLFDGIQPLRLTLMTVTAVLGAWLGRRLVEVIPELLFRRIIVWLLFAISLRLIWSAVATLTA